MKSLLVFLGLVAAISCKSISIDDVIDVEETTAYDYHNRVGIPLANAIREAESKPQSRITGGSHAHLGQIPYQVGLLMDLPGGGTSVCGGSIVNAWRVVTAAHCWTDGHNHAMRMTVVAGSVTLFSGGQRPQTNNVAVHPGWNPSLIRDDVAVVRLPWALGFSNYVGSIPLPTGPQMHMDYTGFTATASGFGGTGDGHPITQQQRLSVVDMPVISNAECSRIFGIIFPSTICASGAGGRSTCGGDSGGPLTAISHGQRILIGITSFVNAGGCQLGTPAGFARVTYFADWIRGLL